MRIHAWLALSLTLAAVSPLRAESWKFDVITSKNGSTFQGLITEETKETVHFKYIVRKPGSRTIVIETLFDQDEIQQIDRLKDAERETLVQRVKALQGRGAREQARLKAVTLEKIPWPRDATGWQYTGKYFVLESNAREELVRQAVVRLEEMFQAYTEKLGTKQQPKQLTRITLYRAIPEYHKALEDLGVNILNPAFYDAQKNRIVAASDLEHQAEELDKVRQKHDALVQELDQQEKKLRQHFNGKPPMLMMSQLRQIRRNVQVVNSENETAMERLNQPLFATLYHEAFHAYLDNFLYPSSESPVPRWLNEGLAQIFETALVETGELRVGHIHEKRRVDVQTAVKNKQLVSLKNLLNSELKHFSVAHRSEALVSDQYFQASWALAYYLTYERKLLGTEALDAYVQSLKRGTDPQQAFRDLVGKPLDEFEAGFHDYLLNLPKDGAPRRPDPR